MQSEWSSDSRTRSRGGRGRGETRSRLALGLFLALCSPFSSVQAVAGGTDDPGEESARTAQVSTLSIEELRELVLEQQQQLELQRDRLEQQATTLQQLLERLEQLESDPGEGATDVVATADSAPVPTAAGRPDETATDGRLPLNLSARQENESVEGEFPGAIELPGTRIAMRPGGFVNVNLVQSSEELGIADRFVTSSIPVGDIALTEGGGAAVSARRSRLNLEVRRASDLGEFRAFVEGDFLGEGSDGSDAFRLRHAFGQYRQLTIGQTWSTFNSPLSGPEELDLEGLNASVIVRKPLVRWTVGSRRGELAIALEEPRIEATGGADKSQFWDPVVRYTRRHERVSYWVGAVVRELGVEPFDDAADPSPSPPEELTSSGWGITGGAKWSLPRFGANDSVQLFGTVGEGVASYINDLDSLGGLDVYVDRDGALRTPLTSAAAVSYGRFWDFTWREFRTLRSTFTLGLVDVDYPTDVQGGALSTTLRGSVNVLWSPISGVDLGVEFLWGRRENVDGETGYASQLQFATFYRF